MGRKIRVLVVDDSAVVRQTMMEILSSDPQIEVMATAADPYVAADRISREVPDVITLDVEMPRMDGITFLHKIMSQHPIPVVMCSGIHDEKSEIALKAMEYGAVDIIHKPRIGTKQFLRESMVRICDAVKAASQARLCRIHARAGLIEPKMNADVIIAKPRKRWCARQRKRLSWWELPPAVPKPFAFCLKDSLRMSLESSSFNICRRVLPRRFRNTWMNDAALRSKKQHTMIP